MGSQMVVYFPLLINHLSVFVEGECGSFQFLSGEERIMFCFASSGHKKCFRLVSILNSIVIQRISRYNGMTYENNPDTVYHHSLTFLGNIGN